MNKKKLIKEVYEGVVRCARNRSVNKQQEQDFIQEGLIAACEVIDRYPDKEDNELICIIGKSAMNRILQIQKQEINWNRRNITKTVKHQRPIDNWDMDEEFDPSDSGTNDTNFDVIDEREFIMVASSFLSDRGKKILNEKICPSIKTIEIMEVEKRNKIKARKNGKLVMNIFTDKITDSHIAKSLGYSKATMSREVNHIREVVLYLKFGLSKHCVY